MKKAMQVALFTTLVAPAFITGSLSAEAVTVGQMNSNTDVTFSQDTSGTSPVNPLDPSENVTANPNDPHESGTAGPLSIDYVSNFHFGTKTIQSTDAVYYANLDQVQNSGGTLIQVPNYAQVTDKRGVNTGWQLSVKQNKQLTASGANPVTLDGAELSLIAATPNSTANAALAPTSQAITLDPTGNATSVVATAAARTGMGTWTLAFGNNSTTGAQGVRLAVPATTNKVTNAQYSTTLTWSLADTPI